MPNPDVFWKSVDRTGGPDACWPWTGFKDDDGYGRYGRQRAHRVAYKLAIGPIPAGFLVRHVTCDNPPCCNPVHLAIGTAADNSADMVAKGRQAKGDRSRSRLYPETLPRGDSHPLRKSPELAARGDRHGSRTHPERIPRGDTHGRHTKPERTPRGEKSGRAKLTEALVAEIRQAAKNGESGASIARRHGIDKSTACRIIRGDQWKHSLHPPLEA